MKRYVILLSVLTLTGCKPQTINKENIHFQTSHDPITTALHYKLASSLQVPISTDITIMPIHYSEDTPISSISRTNYNFYHSQQTLPITCCQKEKCISKNFNVAQLKVKFQDDILEKNNHDISLITDIIQQWINHACIV